MRINGRFSNPSKTLLKGANMKCLFGLSVILSSAIMPAIKAGDMDDGNPLFAPFNAVIDLGKISDQNILASTDLAVTGARASLQSIYQIPKGSRTWDNTMLALDNIQNDLSKVNSIIYLMFSVHPDKAVRDQATASFSIMNQFDTELSMDESLYQAVKEYAATDEARQLTGHRRKFLTETIRDFERNGFALSRDDRERLKSIQNKLSDLGVAFNNNISAANDFLIVTEKEMEGVPEDYKSSRRLDDGSYKIDLSYPSYSGFMKSSTSESARKALYIKNNTRAAERNIPLLDSLLVYRKEMAALLGYETYGQYRVEDRMAGTTKAVWDFENSLISAVRVKAKADYDELLEMKKSYTKDPLANVIQPWETSFYNNLLLRSKYQVDQDAVKEYFELNRVIDGLFAISERLFDVTFEEMKSPSTWHTDVRGFEVKRAGRLIGRFYLDLFPRDNKYSHAACFAMIRGKATVKGYQIPTATLVCNFPKPSADRPSLMYHALGSSSVETFFHEFGHVLHNLLTQSELYSFSGTQVPRDFVEAPSQIFENWVWNYESVKLFARHYKTGEVLPKTMFERMRAAKNVGSGTATLQQVYYGVLDMTLHDRFVPGGSETTTDVVKRLQNEITLTPFLDGTQFQASFGHLVGYGAGYYGYLWSRVYAEDMFSQFEKHGILDQTTGRRYRDIILAKGNSEEPLELVKQFLGREPNCEAFLKSLGL